MDRKQSRLDVACIHCGALGTIVWEENSIPAAQGSQRRLVSLDGEFHAETGRTRSAIR